MDFIWSDAQINQDFLFVLYLIINFNKTKQLLLKTCCENAQMSFEKRKRKKWICCLLKTNFPLYISLQHDNLKFEIRSSNSVGTLPHNYQ